MFFGLLEAPSLRQTRNPTTDAILSYIHSHSDEVTLQQVAEAFHFSRQYCSRLIMELTGCTFSELLTGFRIGKGEELLLHTHLSVEEISARVGYANPETFIRAFRRVRGVSPGQMRRHSRQSQVHGPASPHAMEGSDGLRHAPDSEVFDRNRNAWGGHGPASGVAGPHPASGPPPVFPTPKYL